LLIGVIQHRLLAATSEKTIVTGNQIAAREVYHQCVCSACLPGLDGGILELLPCFLWIEGWPRQPGGLQPTWLRQGGTRRENLSLDWVKTFLEAKPPSR